MDTPGKRPESSFTRRYLTIILLFGICVIGVFILFRTYPYPGGLPGSLYLWVYLFLVVILTLMMAKTVLKDLLHRGRLRGFFHHIAAMGLVRATVSTLMVRKGVMRGPIFLLGFLAAANLLLVLFLWRYDILFDQNLKLVTVADHYRPQAPDSAMHVRILYTSTAGRSAEDRLRWLLKATEDLKNAGARIVVVKLPPYLYRARHTILIDKILATGVAVLAVDTWSSVTNWRNERYVGAVPREGPYRLAGFLTGAPLSRSGDDTFESPLGCFVPFAYSMEHYDSAKTTRRDTTADVSMEVVRKWHGYPETIRPRVNGKEVIFGDYRIPVTPPGLAIVHRLGANWLSAWGGDDFGVDSAGYRGRYANDPGLYQDLSRFSGEISGKVIILGNSDEADSPSLGYYRETAVTSWSINAILERDFLAIRSDLDVWLILAASVLSVLLVLRMKPLLAFICMLLLGVLFAAGAAWLYLEAATIIEVVYPLLILALSMAILPLARLIREVRLGAGT